MVKATKKISRQIFFYIDITHSICHICRLGTPKRFQNGSVGSTTGEISNCSSRFFYSSPGHKPLLFFRSRIFLDLLSVLVIDGFRVPLLLRFFFSTRSKKERAWSANSLKDFFPVWVVIRRVDNSSDDALKLRVIDKWPSSDRFQFLNYYWIKFALKCCCTHLIVNPWRILSNSRTDLKIVSVGVVFHSKARSSMIPQSCWCLLDLFRQKELRLFGFVVVVWVIGSICLFWEVMKSSDHVKEWSWRTQWSDVHRSGNILENPHWLYLIFKCSFLSFG